MKLFEGKTPAERNKLIVAIVLGVIAFAVLSFMFFGSSSGSKSQNRNVNTRRGASNQDVPPGADTAATNTNKLPSPDQVRVETESLTPPRPVVFTRAAYDVPEPRRNIFAFYVPPPRPTPAPPQIPTPTPAPPPPQLLASVSPSNVYARTSDFTLEVSGDKFTDTSAIVVDNNPLPTRFINAQQLSATVPAAMIAAAGARQIMVRTPDGTLYSNPVPLMVASPPEPGYLYIGIIGKARYNDTAVLKDKDNPKADLLNVQRGDLVGGRFRVTSISEREVVLTDTSLRIKHALPFTEQNPSSGSNQAGGTRLTTPQAPFNGSDSGIPGIPSNVPRYQPPGRNEQPPSSDEGNDEEDNSEEIAPGIPGKSRP